MTTPQLIADLERDEGAVPTAYPDPESPLAKACREAGIDPVHYERFQNWQKLSGAPWTVGCGHTGREVHPGLLWSRAQIDAALQADVGAVERGLDTAVPWWEQLSDPRQDVLVNVAFNAGVHGLMGFHHMLAALYAGDYATAAEQLLDSDAARKLVKRYGRLAAQLKTGLRAA